MWKKASAIVAVLTATAPKNADAEDAYKLWLAHGVTTVRGVSLAGNAFTVSEKAREWVRWAKDNGIDGLKVGAHQPDIMAALLDEAKKLGRR